jgi:signal peptidase I
MSAVSVLRRHALTAATLVVAAVWFVALRPAELGGPATYVMVRGTSMTGTLATGDLVVVVASDHYAVGDIVAYRIPSGPGQGDLVIHRITAVDAAGYQTQGDANKSADPWHPTQSDVLGRLEFRIPGIGQLLVTGHSPAVLGAIWASVAFVLAFGLTAGGRKVWRYTKAMGLSHWPLAPSESPSWVTQALYREARDASGSRAVQVWSRRDRAWLDLLVDDSFERSTWFGDSVIDFGDPMIVEATAGEVDAYAGSSARS